MKQRGIVHEPSLVLTLKSLQPGDFVRLGNRWSYGTVREMASKLGIKIRTKRSDKGITLIRQQEIPE